MTFPGSAYYNEWEKFPAEWLCNLMAAGRITNGRVDQRSIRDVPGYDLAGYERVHLFAGIAGWELALELAGWPKGLPVWTGSCPCQPFSTAGKRKGTADERHLWPEMLRLISECRPPVVFGEQVASKLGRAWLSTVRADLEALGYAVGAADLCAAGVGAPHIRQRLWWVAHAPRERRTRLDSLLQREGQGGELQDCAQVAGGCADGERMDNAADQGLPHGTRREGEQPRAVAELERSRLHDPWRDPAWLPCSDGKARPTQPGVQLMVDGISFCLGLLRAEQGEEVRNAAQTSGLGDEVLRAVRSRDDAAAVWESLGRCIGVSKATLLFSALLEQSRELGDIIFGSASGFGEVSQGGPRGVPQDGTPPCAPQGPQYSQQRAEQFADLVHSMSLGFAQTACFNGFPLAVGVPNRVGQLRAAGNAIVPQVAATFVRAFMDAQGI